MRERITFLIMRRAERAVSKQAWEADVLPLHHSREILRHVGSLFHEIRHCN